MNELSHLFREPELTTQQLIERRRVKDTQEALDAAGCPYEDMQPEDQSVIDRAIAQLDAECTYMDTPVAVTGQVRLGRFDPEEGAFGDDTCVADGAVWISRGFCHTVVGGGEVVGHLFEAPEESVLITTDSSLVIMRSHSMAFAPYGAVAIDAERTNAERCNYLEYLVPDHIAGLDERLYSDDADSPLDALLQLRELSVDTGELPEEAITELVCYATETLEVDRLPLTQFTIEGIFLEESDDGELTVLVVDMGERLGGTLTFMAQPGKLCLVSGISYLDHEVHQGPAHQWGVAVDPVVLPHGYSHFRGRQLILPIASIREATEVTLG